MIQDASKTGLRLYVNEEIERPALQALPTPDRTDTHVPIPHYEALTRAERAFTQAGFAVAEEVHGVAGHGLRYFGLLKLVPTHGTPVLPGPADWAAPPQHSSPPTPAKDWGLVVGIRNSHDKSFPFGIVGGAQVYVCENLGFWGEYKITLKHTAHIRDRIDSMVWSAVGRLIGAYYKQDASYDRYKQTALSPMEANDAIIRSYEAGAITTKMIPGVLAEWKRPSYPEFQPRNAWSLFNSVTQTMKGSSFTMLPTRTTRLSALFNDLTGVTTHDTIPGEASDLTESTQAASTT